MKIFFLSFYGGMNQRGVERWVYELASRLSVSHKITVFQNMPLKVHAKYDIKTSNVRYDSKKRSKNRLLRHLFIDYDSLIILIFNILILKSLLKENYDIIVPTDGGWEPAIVRLITWIKRKKMIIVGHAGIGWDDANNIWSFPDVFIALSQQAKIWAEMMNPFVRTVYISDGVDTEKFTSDGKKVDLGFNNNYPIAICPGALEAGKRMDLVIKGVSEAGNVNLLICGRGELKDKLSELGNRLLGDRFKMHEFNFEDMPKIYRSCDILVSASLPQFSFEMVIPEAMASGLPVVANNDPIRDEIVGEAGILTNPCDSTLLSEAIKKVLGKKWHRLPQKQAGKFSWDIVVKKYDSLFTNLLVKN